MAEIVITALKEVLIWALCLNTWDLNSFILPTFCDNTVLLMDAFYVSLPFEHVNKYLECFLKKI